MSPLFRVALDDMRAQFKLFHIPPSQTLISLKHCTLLSLIPLYSLLWGSYCKLAVLRSKYFARLRCHLKRYRKVWQRCIYLVQEDNSGLPESNINAQPFDLDAFASWLHLHKTANFKY